MTSRDASQHAQSSNLFTGVSEELPDMQMHQNEFRKLPAVDALLRQPAIALLTAEHGTTAVTGAIRFLLEEQRAQIVNGQPAPALEQWPFLVDDYLAQRNMPSLRPVINATGVIIHTNLGRAPLSENARKAVQSVTESYSNLEYALDTGRRGSRYDHARDLLCELTGAEDAVVVNNCASALYLVLSVFCREREVIISRGQLVEIGGGFRIPDVLRQSGARLVEVGTTNRTHGRDFAQAMSERTAALLRVHTSNFRQIGFVTTPELSELVTIANDAAQHLMTSQENSGPSHSGFGATQAPIVIDDLGSGALLSTAPYGLMAEPTAQESIAAGAHIVTFSGDKLLGGPQAGIIVGCAERIAQVRRHPMMRALRVDKMTLSALEATLHSYRSGRALQEIPIWQMISAPAEQMQMRAAAWQQRLRTAGIKTTVRQAQSAVGGGSLPGETMPTYVLALSPADNQVLALSPADNQVLAASSTTWAAQLRGRPTPVVCRIQDEQLLFDPRTVLPQQEESLLESIQQVCTQPSATLPSRPIEEDGKEEPPGADFS